MFPMFTTLLFLLAGGGRRSYSFWILNGISFAFIIWMVCLLADRFRINMVNVVVPARNRIFHFVVTVLGLALSFLSYNYLVPLYNVCDRGISITVSPISWSSGNNSFMSWSCVDGGGCTSEEERDSLEQQIQNLTTSMAARNSSCERTIDSLKAELKSQIEESQKNNSVLLEDCERNLMNLRREKDLEIASLNSTIVSLLQINPTERKAVTSKDITKTALSGCV